MIRNPIIHKEVLSSLRTKKAIVMQVLFLATTMGLVCFLWPEGGLQSVTSGQDARRILGVLAVGQLILVALFAPAFTATSLTSESEKNTLESLFATALRPWEIATGKMLGSLTFLFLAVLSGTPALAMAFLLGGAPWTDVLAVVGLLLLTAVYLGMIGLLVSALMHRSYSAIIVTYAILLAICFLFALPAWPVSRNLISRGGPVWQNIVHVIVSLSPLEAMLSLIWKESTYTIGARGMPPFWQLYIPLSAGVTVVTAAICLYKLHRPIAPPRPREKVKIVERGEITARTFIFLVDPRKRKRMIRWWQNPMLIKEFRTRPMLQAQWLLRAVSTCLIVSVLLMLLVSISVTAFVAEATGMIPMMATAVAALMVVFILLVGPSMTSGSICADRESGVWDLIRTTALPSWRIVSGKFQAAIIPLLLFAMAMTPALAILLYFNLDLWINILRSLAVVGVTILFVATAGMFFSSMFSRTSTATAWTYTVVVTLGLMTLLLLLAEDRFSQKLVRSIFLVNPVAAAMDAAGHAGMQKLNLFAAHLKIMGAATAAMFAITVVRVFQLRRRD